MALIKKIPIWLAITELPFIFFSYKYLMADSLAVYDASSHFAQIWYIKEYLWPNFSGFNPYNLLGFDQGLLYPSLFHFSAATLGFLFDLELATKLIVVASLLLLPVSCYLFSSLFFFQPKARVFSAAMLLVVLCASPGFWGANIKGLVQVGLLPSFVSLPFVLLYFWSLLKARGNWVLPSILLSIVILTHLVAGIVCLLVLFSSLLVSAFNKTSFGKFPKHLSAVLGLTAFFTVPFIVNYNLTSQSVHLASMFLPNIVLLIVLASTAIIVWKARIQNLYPILLAALVLNSLVILDALTLRFLDTGFFFDKIYNLHLYRFQIYLYLLSLILVGYWPIRFLFEIPRKSLLKREIILALPLVVIVLALVVRPPFLGTKVKTNTKSEKTNNRFIETFSREDSYPFIYTSQNKLVTQEKKAWAYGLLTDSTPNGPFLASLIRSFDPFAKKQDKQEFVERSSLDRGRIYDMLDLLAIDGLLFIEPVNGVGEDTINTRLLGNGVGKNLVEIPKLEIENTNGDWDQKVKEWWFEKGKLQNLLVENAIGIKEASTSAQIKNLKSSPNWSKFSFEVDSKEKTPVLVKFTYLPGWVAKANGKETRIYKASPYLMLINANGKIEFEYKKQWYQQLSLAVSVFTLILITLLTVRNKLEKNAKN